MLASDDRIFFSIFNIAPQQGLPYFSASIAMNEETVKRNVFKPF